MNYELLTEEMNNLLELMAKEGPDSDNYATYMKRLSDLQQMAINGKEQELAETRQKEELKLKRREQALTEEEIKARTRNSKRETTAEYGKTVLGGAFTLGAILVTQFIEQNDIIRTKGWGFINNLIRRI